MRKVGRGKSREEKQKVTLPPDFPELKVCPCADGGYGAGGGGADEESGWSPILKVFLASPRQTFNLALDMEMRSHPRPHWLLPPCWGSPCWSLLCFLWSEPAGSVLSRCSPYSTPGRWAPDVPPFGSGPSLSSGRSAALPTTPRPGPARRVGRVSGSRPSFSPLLSQASWPCAAPRPPAWVSGAWQDRAVKCVADVLGVRGLVLC